MAQQAAQIDQMSAQALARKTKKIPNDVSSTNLQDLCDSSRNQLYSEMRNIWQNEIQSSRFKNWSNRSLALLTVITKDIKEMQIEIEKRARCLSTLDLIKFYIVALCGVIPSQGKMQGILLLEIFSEQIQTFAAATKTVVLVGADCPPGLSEPRCKYESADEAAMRLGSIWTQHNNLSKMEFGWNIVQSHVCSNLAREW
ncbi:uncharacterized protein B0I36DRAFT_356596 [Microdochium trichocladiopsis]|uniref:Uncharacterized protein n=1 Tax=Microdochium trichocladiopsis TaxID=1682393 RepID=A0A9P9BI74_9PEZI|nr:uncharacterized protein B0I36DRAFT_356596 [Microdochium trichocladiopsis]KAH7010697.1 hypothetical protein B0I36DRAFT_356596 [Microdochium trichocladiopsis]